MLNQITIEGFKSIDKQSLALKPLTIVTGVNSTGKSSALQSLLLWTQHINSHNQNSFTAITQPYCEFNTCKNRYTNAKQITIQVSSDGLKQSISVSANRDQNWQASDTANRYFYESNNSEASELFYLSANRQGPESLSAISANKVGKDGEFLLNSYETNKSQSLPESLCANKVSNTLSSQVSFWLSEILGSDSSLQTEKITPTTLKTTFSFDGLTHLDPENLGAGVSYLTKVIICCLIAKAGDIVLIENPEIHLHPKAQSLLGKFFCFIANAGIQTVIETHCEHLINQVCYQIYEDNFDAPNTIIHYKPAITAEFIPVVIDEEGQYVIDEKTSSFPSGFFDATLSELIAMR